MGDISRDKREAVARHECEAPKPPTPVSELPDAITVFVTRSERTAVLRALRAIHPDRANALLLALGIDASSPSLRGGDDDRE
ncbi:MAG: hypothetical protein AB8F26_05230 [Phycisphaerales bacterium]